MPDETRRDVAQPTALACVSGAIPAAERSAHFSLLARLFGEGAVESRRLADGYAYRFEADAFDDVARWIANERRCCPFLAFTVELSPDGGPLWLSLSGPPGTPEFLDAELSGERGRTTTGNTKQETNN